MTQDANDPAITHARKTLDRQAVMAVVGLLAVAAFLVFKPGDWQGTWASLAPILPWLIGLCLAVVIANRWSLSQRVKAIEAARETNPKAS